MSDGGPNLCEEVLFRDTIFNLDNKPSRSRSIEPLNRMRRVTAPRADIAKREKGTTVVKNRIVCSSASSRYSYEWANYNLKGVFYRFL